MLKKFLHMSVVLFTLSTAAASSNSSNRDTETKPEVTSKQPLVLPDSIEQHSSSSHLSEYEIYLEEANVTQREVEYEEMIKKKIEEERERKRAKLKEPEDGLMPRPLVDHYGGISFLLSILQCFAALRGRLFTVPSTKSMPVLDTILIMMPGMLVPQSVAPWDPGLVYSVLHPRAFGEFERGGENQMDASKIVRCLYDLMSKEQPAFGNVICWHEVKSADSKPASQMVHFVEIVSNREARRREIYEDLHLATEEGDEDWISELHEELAKIDNPIELSSLLEAYYSEKVVNGGAKAKRVGQLPAVYTVALKRFYENPYSGQWEKNKESVRVPEFLTVTSESFMNPSAGVFHMKDQATYRIKAVLLHKGTLTDYHYVALVRIGLGWFLCDDKKIERSSFSIIKDGQYRTFTPLLLFYDRQE